MPLQHHQGDPTRSPDQGVCIMADVLLSERHIPGVSRVPSQPGSAIRPHLRYLFSHIHDEAQSALNAAVSKLEQAEHVKILTAVNRNVDGDSVPSQVLDAAGRGTSAARFWEIAHGASLAVYFAGYDAGGGRKF